MRCALLYLICCFGTVCSLRSQALDVAIQMRGANSAWVPADAAPAPGLGVNCENVVVGMDPAASSLQTATHWRLRLWEDQCGLNAPQLIFNSGRNAMDGFFQTQPERNLASFDVGLPGEQRACYFLDVGSSPDAADYCFTVEYTLYTATDSASAAMYFQVLDCNWPPTSFVAFDTAFCAGKAIDFTVTNNLGMRYAQWAFPGSVELSFDRASPTDITYPTPGSYDVTLFIENCLGVDTIIKTDYIRVLEAPVYTDSADVVLYVADNAQVELPICATASQYDWSPGFSLSCTDCPNPTFTAGLSTNYVGRAFDDPECAAECRVSVRVGEAPDAYFRLRDSLICQTDCIDVAPPPTVEESRFTYYPGDGRVFADSLGEPRTFCYEQPGEYFPRLVVESRYGRDSFTVAAPLIVQPEATAALGPAIVRVNPNAPLTLRACAPADRYVWSTARDRTCGTCDSIGLTARYNQRITVALHYDDPDRCPGLCVFDVRLNEPEVYLPNAFSPNADGINDTFAARGTGFEPVALTVFDRWGGRVSSGNGTWNGERDGQAVPTGIYVYQLTYRNSYTGELVTTGGSVLVVR